MAAIGAANAAGSAAAVGGAGANGERGGAGEGGAGLAAGDGVRCRSWTGTTSPRICGQQRRWCMGKAARKQWRSICESWWRRATMTRTTLCAIPPSQKKRATPPGLRSETASSAALWTWTYAQNGSCPSPTYLLPKTGAPGAGSQARGPPPGRPLRRAGAPAGAGRHRRGRRWSQGRRWRTEPGRR